MLKSIDDDSRPMTNTETNWTNQRVDLLVRPLRPRPRTPTPPQPTSPSVIQRVTFHALVPAPTTSSSSVRPLTAALRRRSIRWTARRGTRSRAMSRDSADVRPSTARRRPDIQHGLIWQVGDPQQHNLSSSSSSSSSPPPDTAVHFLSRWSINPYTCQTNVAYGP